MYLVMAAGDAGACAMLSLMPTLHDLHIGAAQLLRARGFAATAIVTLTLAIGAATLMTSATQAVLLRSGPVAAPGELVVAWGSNPAVTAGIIELSYLDIAALARDGRTLAVSRGSRSSDVVLITTGR